jgi:hypothetical protein
MLNNFEILGPLGKATWSWPTLLFFNYNSQMAYSQILANKDASFGIGFEILGRLGWATWSWPTLLFFNYNTQTAYSQILKMNSQILANKSQNIGIGFKLIREKGWANFTYVKLQADNIIPTRRKIDRISNYYDFSLRIKMIQNLILVR